MQPQSNASKPRSLDVAWEPTDDEQEPNYAPQRWVRVPLDAPLLLPLVTNGYVVSDIPVFTVVALGTEHYARMKEAAGGSFPTLVVPDLPSM